MASDDAYLKRLWSLHDPSKADRVRDSADLLKVLRDDFNGPRQLFTEVEYKDPRFRETVIEEIIHPDRGRYFFPAEVAKFIHALLGDGPALCLYPGFGDILFEFGSGTGVEPNKGVAEWSNFFAAIAGLDIEVIVDDPVQWSTNKKFERISCNPPFGRPGDELAVMERALSFLLKGGQLAVVVAPNFLWGTRAEKSREAILKRASVAAVISLPSNLFAHTSIPSAILVLKEGRGDKSYLARSKNVGDLDAIAKDYWSWRQGQKFTLGFEKVLETSRWDVAYNEPIDFDLGGVTFPYKVVSLGEIVEMSTGKLSEDAKIAINRTGSEVVWVADEPDLKPKNNVFILPGKDVNASYLHLYLKSTIGSRALAGLIKGAYMPHVSAKDLARLPVVLPEPRQQSQIVSDALELHQTIASLQALTTEGKQTLAENLFGLKAAKEKFQKFSTTTEAVRYQQLPFPIAVVQRKIKNAPNNTQKFSLLIELFEVVIRFIALVQLADYINNRKQAALVAEQVPDIRKLFAPALGDWVGIFKAFARIKSPSESTPFLAEIKNFKLDKYQRTLEEFVDIRNASLRGHGATLTEDEYELRFQEHARKVYDLIDSLGFLANYTLIKTGHMEKNGDFFKIAAHTLMGDNPHFETGHILLRTPLESNKVMYLNRDQESLVLDPYIVLERCPECKRPEVLLFDKLSDKRITYIAYESGHRPVLETADRLPSMIREVATRRV